MLHLELCKIFVRAKNHIPESEMGGVVAHVFAMMEIVELVVCAEGQQLNRSPAEVITRMADICIPNPQDKPTHQCTDMHGPV